MDILDIFFQAIKFIKISQSSALLLFRSYVTSPSQHHGIPTQRSVSEWHCITQEFLGKNHQFQLSKNIIGPLLQQEFSAFQTRVPLLASSYHIFRKLIRFLSSSNMTCSSAQPLRICFNKHVLHHSAWNKTLQARCIRCRA